MKSSLKSPWSRNHDFECLATNTHLQCLQNPMVTWSQFTTSKVTPPATLHLCIIADPQWTLLRLCHACLDTHTPSFTWQPLSRGPPCLCCAFPATQTVSPSLTVLVPCMILMQPPWPFVLYDTSAPLSFCCAGHLRSLPGLLHTLRKHCWAHITPPWPLMHPPLSGNRHQ